MPATNEVLWYPMRVTYNRELKIKGYLDEMQIENFVPMKYEWKGKTKYLVPAIHNLIFIRSTQEIITNLKRCKKEFEPLRYMIRPSKYHQESSIIYVPKHQMDNFMQVATAQDDSIMFLDVNSYIEKVGKRVKITEGQFKNVEGVIKRIKKNKYVVVQIEGIAAVAITYVPAEWLTEIS